MSMRIMAGFLLAGAAMAVVVDRIAVTVDNDAITESEVIQDIRITDFLNGAPLDFSSAARRTAAERLVDQALIRREMNIGRYPQPQKSEAEQMLVNFKKSHFAKDAEFQAALAKYGITADQLRSHLLWELSALRFTDVRFQPGAGDNSPPGVRNNTRQCSAGMRRAVSKMRNRASVSIPDRVRLPSPPRPSTSS
jgi:hypothetical protein